MGRGKQSHHPLVSVIILLRRTEPFSLVVAYEASSSIFTTQRQFAHLRPDERETLGGERGDGGEWLKLVANQLKVNLLEASQLRFRRKLEAK